MRWLVIVLLVSVAALLVVAGGVARHVWRQRRLMEEAADLDAQKARNTELDMALDLQEHESDSADRHSG